MEKNRAGECEWGFFGGSSAGTESSSAAPLRDLRAIHVDFACGVVELFFGGRGMAGAVYTVHPKIVHYSEYLWDFL